MEAAHEAKLQSHVGGPLSVGEGLAKTQQEAAARATDAAHTATVRAGNFSRLTPSGVKDLYNKHWIAHDAQRAAAMRTKSNLLVSGAHNKAADAHLKAAGIFKTGF